MARAAVHPPASHRATVGVNRNGLAVPEVMATDCNRRIRNGKRRVGGGIGRPAVNRWARSEDPRTTRPVNLRAGSGSRVGRDAVLRRPAHNEEFAVGRAGPPGQPRITNDAIRRTARPAVTPYHGFTRQGGLSTFGG